MLLAVSMALPGRGQTTSTNSPSATNSVPAKPAYKFIAERNIFNPNRYAGSGEGRVDPKRVAGYPGFSLVGTMFYDKGTFAFFDGTDSQYKKVLQTSGTIADYRVAEIAPQYVRLEANGNQAVTNHVTLPVGMQLKKFPEGDWRLVAGTESFGGSSDGGSGRWGDRRNRFGRSSDNSSSSSSGAAPPAAPGSGSSSSAGGSSSDILKRLMQQREQEMQK